MPIPGIVISRSLKRVAHTDTAANQIHREKKRAEYHRLINMRALVIAQSNDWIFATACAMRIGEAGAIQRVTRMQDAIAQGQRTTWAKRNVIENDGQIIPTNDHFSTTDERDRADDQSDHGIW